MSLRLPGKLGIQPELRRHFVQFGAVGIPVGTPVLSVASTLTTTMGVANAEITYTADTRGVYGDTLSVEYVVDGLLTPLSVEVNGRAIVVNLETDGAGVGISTGTEVRDAVNAHVVASTLVTAANTGTGNGVPIAKAAEFLAGGVNATEAVVGAVAVNAAGTLLYVCPAGNGVADNNWMMAPANFIPLA